jgi:hypothetical protein
MTNSIPDIMGEYVSETKRYLANGVQYQGYFEPHAVAPGQLTTLHIFLQNTLDVPVQIFCQIDLPKTGGFFGGGKPILQTETTTVQLELGPIEAGLVTMPALVGEATKAGDYSLTLTLKTKPNGKGKRLRPAEAQSHLERKFIDSPAGLDLISTMGATYTEQSIKKASFDLKIAGSPQPIARAPKLKMNYQKLWGQEDNELFDEAHRLVKSLQPKLKNDLTTEALYIVLYNESTSRFADAGLALRIGEAIILGKILTYSCQYFLSSPKRQNGLLVPIWERALDTNIDTGNPLQVMRSVGYNHILKLAIAMSFGLVARVAGRQLWSVEERQAVTQHIANNVTIGETTDDDFLYLPLMMGGALIAGRVELEGEKLSHSLALLQKAYQARPDLFADEDMSQAKKIYRTILTKAVEAAT